MTFKSEITYWLGDNQSVKLFAASRKYVHWMLKSQRLHGERMLNNEGGVNGLVRQAVSWVLTTEGPWNQGFNEFFSAMRKEYGIEAYASQRVELIPLHLLVDTIPSELLEGGPEEVLWGTSGPQGVPEYTIKGMEPNILTPTDLWLLSQKKEDLEILETHQRTGSPSETAELLELPLKYVKRIIARARMWGLRHSDTVGV